MRSAQVWGVAVQVGNLQVPFLARGVEERRGDREAEAGGQAGPDGPQLDHHGIDAAGQDERAAGREAGHERGRDGLDLDAAVSLAGAYLAAHVGHLVQHGTVLDARKNDLVGGVPDGGGAVRSPAFAELAHAVGDGDDAHALTGGVRQPHVEGDADDLAYLVQGEQQRRVQLARRGAGARQGGLALREVHKAAEQRLDDDALRAGRHQVQGLPRGGEPGRVERAGGRARHHGGHRGHGHPGQGLGHGHADAVRAAALAGGLREHRAEHRGRGRVVGEGGAADGVTGAVGPVPDVQDGTAGQGRGVQQRGQRERGLVLPEGHVTGAARARADQRVGPGERLGRVLAPGHRVPAEGGRDAADTERVEHVDHGHGATGRPRC